MKRKLLLFLLVLTFAISSTLVVSCGKTDNKQTDKIQEVYNQYVVYAQGQGQQPLSYENWLATIKGEKGVGISSLTINADGNLLVTFTDGTTQILDLPEQEVAESLRFQKIAGKQEYRVVSIGNVSDLDVVIPSTYKGLPVTVINSNAFSGCTSLTSVTIPDSVKSIGDRAFNNCSSLTSVTIPNSVTSIGEYAFSSCSRLKCVTIGNSVTSIGDDAFAYCDSLKSVTIGDSVTSIGNYAFYNCRSLTSVTIPDSVTSIGRDAFATCTSLTSITIPNSVTSIGYDAFAYCGKLTSVTFVNPNGWRAGDTLLNSVDLENTSTAATYLRSTYASYYWERNV